MKVSIDAYRRQLHKLVERPLQLVPNQTFDFKLPRAEIDLGRSVCVEHGPLLRARLSARHSILTPRVRTDDEIGIVDLFRLARIGGLILRILKKIVEKTHKQIMLISCLCARRARAVLRASTCPRPSPPRHRCRLFDRASRRDCLPLRERARSFPFVPGSAECRRRLPSSPATESRGGRLAIPRSSLPRVRGRLARESLE